MQGNIIPNVLTFPLKRAIFASPCLPKQVKSQNLRPTQEVRGRTLCYCETNAFKSTLLFDVINDQNNLKLEIKNSKLFLNLGKVS